MMIVFMMKMMYSRGEERKQQKLLTDTYKYKFLFAEKSFKSWGLSKNRFLELPTSALERKFPQTYPTTQIKQISETLQRPLPPSIEKYSLSKDEDDDNSLSQQLCNFHMETHPPQALTSACLPPSKSGLCKQKAGL